MPWAHDGCPACNGLGLNSKGTVCAVCKGKAAKKGDDFPQPEDYEIVVDDDGYYMAVERDDGDDDDEPEDKPARSRKKATKKKTTKKKTTKKTTSRRRKPAEDEDDGEADETPEEPKSARGRPKGKPVIYFGCFPETRNGALDIAVIFNEVTPALAKRMKKKSYWDCDTWDRRAAFQMSSDKLADRYRNKHIVCNTRDPDHLALFEALRPHSEVVRGCHV